MDNIISIHAPLTGSDAYRYRCEDIPSRFQSTLPLRGATQRHSIGQIADQFQSTLPLRGATFPVHSKRRTGKYFNPRSPYGERPDLQNHWVYRNPDFNPRSPYGERHQVRNSGRPPDQISIHAPLTGSDCREGLSAAAAPVFQSTLPLRGATLGNKSGKDSNLISIHAPLTGSDRVPSPGHAGDRHFNPRSPYGERPARSTFHTFF